MACFILIKYNVLMACFSLLPVLALQPINIGILMENKDSGNFNDLQNILKIVFLDTIKERIYPSMIELIKDYQNSINLIIIAQPKLTGNMKMLSNISLPVAVTDRRVHHKDYKYKNSCIQFETRNNLLHEAILNFGKRLFNKQEILILYSKIYEGWHTLLDLVKSFSMLGYKLHVYQIGNDVNFDNYDNYNAEQIMLLSSWSSPLFRQTKLHLSRNYVWIVYGIAEGDDFSYLDSKSENIYFVLEFPKNDLLNMTQLGNFNIDNSIKMNLWNLVEIVAVLQNFSDYINLYGNQLWSAFQDQKEFYKNINDIITERGKIEVWNQLNNVTQRIISFTSNSTIYESDYIKEYWKNKTNIKKYSFKNNKIRICVLEYVPFLTITNKTLALTSDNISGFLSRIISHLAKELEFVPDIYLPNDGQYGVQMTNHSAFTGCVGEVQIKNATFAAGSFTFNNERNGVVDYTYPLMTDPIIVIYQNPHHKSRWWNSFLSVNLSIWMVTFLSMCVVAILTTIFCKFSPFSAWNLQLTFYIKDEILFGEHLWTSIGSFLMQGQDFYAYPISSRMITATWWIVSAIFLAVYSADLTSILTIDRGQTLPDTLEGVADSEEITLHLTIGYAITANLKASKDSTLQKLYMKSKFVPDCYDMLKSPFSQNIACISDFSQMKYVQLMNCSRYTIVSEIIESTFTGFLVPKLSEYKESFDKEIQMLSDTGIILKWFYEDLQTNNEGCETENYIPMPINFDNSAGIFIVTLIMYILGVVLLYVEIYVKKFYKHRK